MSDRAGSPAMKAEELLEQAADVVARRRSTYGQPTELFEHVAKRWSLVLGVEVTAAQAILCLIDLKAARLAHDPRHPQHSTANEASRASVIGTATLLIAEAPAQKDLVEPSGASE